MRLIKIKKLKKVVKIFFVLLLVVSWTLAGWPQIPFINFPPKIREARAVTQFLTSGTSFSVPSDWNDANNSIEVISGGGGGRNGANAGAGGGGGGAYAKSTNVNLPEGGTVTYSVGTGGGAGTAGGNTWFCNNTTSCANYTDTNVVVSADGGDGATSATGALGGDLTGITNVATEFVGGDGGTGANNGDTGGGGGGAAGPGGAGQNGGAAPAGSAASGGGGGSGGASSTVGSPASGGIGGNGGHGYGGTGGGTGGNGGSGGAGTAPGAGGGGGDTGNFSGGAGAAGQQWDSTHGSGGGGGGATNNASPGVGGAGALYGGGGGGSDGSTGAGSGAQGLIIIIYTPPTTSLTQNDWRIYVNNSLLDPTDPWGNPDLGENTALDAVPPSNDPIDVADEVRLRMSIAVTLATLAATTEDFILQYKEASDCTDATAWTDVDAAGGAGIWRFTSLTDVADNTALSVDPPTAGDLNLAISDVAGRYNRSDPTTTNPFEVLSGEDLEWDWHIQYNGTQAAKTYCFRMVKNVGGASPLDAYNSDSYPRVDIRPGTNDLMRHGNFFTTGVDRGFFWAN